MRLAHEAQVMPMISSSTWLVEVGEPGDWVTAVIWFSWVCCSVSVAGVVAAVVGVLGAVVRLLRMRCLRPSR